MLQTVRVCSAALLADFPIMLANNGKQTCPLYSLSQVPLFIPFLLFFT